MTRSGTLAAGSEIEKLMTFSRLYCYTTAAAKKVWKQQQYSSKKKQEIWASAHETRDSISIISYAGCLGLSPVISAKIHSKCASQPEIVQKSPNTHIFGFKVVQGHRCWHPPENSSAVLVMIRSKSKSVSICNRSHARLVDSNRNRVFCRGYPNLMHLYGGLLEPKGVESHTVKIYV